MLVCGCASAINRSTSSAVPTGTVVDHHYLIPVDLSSYIAGGGIHVGQIGMAIAAT